MCINTYEACSTNGHEIYEVVYFIYNMSNGSLDLVVKQKVVGKLALLLQTAYVFSWYFTVLWHCLLQQKETEYPHQCLFNHVGHKHSRDLLNTAMIEVMVKFF